MAPGNSGSLRAWAWSTGRTDVVAALDLGSAVEEFVLTPSLAGGARLHARVRLTAGSLPAWSASIGELEAMTGALVADDARLDDVVEAVRRWLHGYLAGIAAETALNDRTKDHDPEE